VEMRDLFIAWLQDVCTWLIVPKIKTISPQGTSGTIIFLSQNSGRNMMHTENPCYEQLGDDTAASFGKSKRRLGGQLLFPKLTMLTVVSLGRKKRSLPIKVP